MFSVVGQKFEDEASDRKWMGSELIDIVDASKSLRLNGLTNQCLSEWRSNLKLSLLQIREITTGNDIQFAALLKSSSFRQNKFTV